MRCLHSQKNTTSRTLPPSWLTSRRCIDRGTRGVQKPNPTTSEGCSIKLIVRRVLIGLVFGTISSLFLCLAVRNIGLGLSLGALLGIAQIFAFFEGSSPITRIFRRMISEFSSSIHGDTFVCTAGANFLPGRKATRDYTWRRLVGALLSQWCFGWPARPRLDLYLCP